MSYLCNCRCQRCFTMINVSYCTNIQMRFRSRINIIVAECSSQSYYQRRRLSYRATASQSLNIIINNVYHSCHQQESMYHIQSIHHHRRSWSWPSPERNREPTKNQTSNHQYITVDDLQSTQQITTHHVKASVWVVVCNAAAPRVHRKDAALRMVILCILDEKLLLIPIPETIYSKSMY